MAVPTNGRMRPRREVEVGCAELDRALEERVDGEQAQFGGVRGSVHGLVYRHPAAVL
jgi:hypothetical protein